MDYQQEQNEWDNFVNQAIGSDAKLLSVSVYSSDSRIYQLDERIFKIRRITPASYRGRLNSLEDEFLILKHVSSIANIPKPKNYMRKKRWELMEMNKLPSLFMHDPTFGQPDESLKDFVSVMKLAWKLNKLGCSHGDYSPQNVGRNSEGFISLFDFDQACIANPLQCWLRDFLGIGISARPTDISLLKRACNVEIIGTFVRAIGFFKKAVIRLIRSFQNWRGLTITNVTPLQNRVALLGDHNLNKLAEAWSIAATSDASSPGHSVAYYSLDISGINFPGERPWVLRWNGIEESINFEGKKFLELGSNLGLLSIHAKLNGATACLGVDIDHDIVKAATMAANAFEVDIKFRQQNLDDASQWEKELNGYDIVSALSVLHWVKNKERVWSFLGTHKEILYEGHESNDEAEDSLRKHGFVKIVRLGQSERGRQMIYAKKN